MAKKRDFVAWVKKCQMYSFEVVNKSKMAYAISKILFILGSNKILACLERVRSYAWSFGHSAPDPSSVREVCTYVKTKEDTSDYVFLYQEPKNVICTYFICEIYKEPLKVLFDR